MSWHYDEERKTREQLIEAMGEGKTLREFPYNHPTAGKQIHRVLDNGVIEVVKSDDRDFVITKLIARPAQLKRLYNEAGERVPADLWVRACKNKDNGYNNF